MKAPQICTHTRTNGTGCRALALAGKAYCYFHQRDRDRQARIDQNLNHRRQCLKTGRHTELFKLLPGGEFIDDNSATLLSELQLGNFEDGDAIQIALSSIFRAIATRQMDRGLGTALLYNLQIAVMNLRNVATPDRDWNSQASQDNEPVFETPGGADPLTYLRSLLRASPSPDKHAPQSEPAEITIDSEEAS